MKGAQNYFDFASDDLCRAAAFAWINPFRAERSRSCTAFAFSAGLAVPDLAVLSALRRVERCARLRAVATLVLRMFFFAEAILGTGPDSLQNEVFGGGGRALR